MDIREYNLTPIPYRGCWSDPGGGMPKGKEVIHQETQRRFDLMHLHAPSRIIHQCQWRERPATTSIFLHKLYESRLIGVKEIMTVKQTYKFDEKGHTIVETECQHASPLNESWMGRRFCNHKKALGACDFCEDLKSAKKCPKELP